MQTITAKIPEEVHARLERLASKIDRKKSYLVRQAIEGFIEDQEDYLIAIARLSKKRKRIPLAELERELGLNR